MLIQEIVTINNKKLKHSYSSENKYIKQVETDAIYIEAYDSMIRNFHYVETDKIIEIDVPQSEINV